MTDDTPRLCFSYLRFSRAEQAKGSSTKRQTDLREAYCQRHNLVLDTSRMITGEGISAYNGHNSVEGNLAEFLDLVKGGSVPRGSVLLIESIDRLSRDQIIPARNLLESILLAGIDVHTLQPERIYTSKSLEDVQSLILMILEFSRAHDYSQQLGNRISAAWSSKREKAKTNQTPLSKCPPAWLRVVDGKYEVRAVGRKDPKIVPYLQDQSNGNSYPLSYFEFYMLGWLVKFEPEPTTEPPPA